MSDRELYGKLVAGAPPDSGAAAFLAERAELLLRQADRPDLRTRTQCVEYLGKHFRVALEQPASATNYEVGGARGVSTRGLRCAAEGRTLVGTGPVALSTALRGHHGDRPGALTAHSHTDLINGTGRGVPVRIFH